MKSLGCRNKACPPAAAGSIIRYGFYNTKSGKRRRYRCLSCGKTFCANSGTPYHRLQHRRSTFNDVAALSVEGLNKSAIARVKQIACNTVARWLEKAAHSCRRFNDRRIATLAIAALQADEIRTIVGSTVSIALCQLFALPQQLSLIRTEFSVTTSHRGPLSGSSQPQFFATCVAKVSQGIHRLVV